MVAGEAGLNVIDQSCSQPSPRRPLLPDDPGSRVTAGGSKRPARLVFYSHDAQGLGHIRRNLNIANYLINAGLDATILLICGTRWISRLNLSAAIDTLILPALRKHSDGSYEPRHLQIDQSQLMECRRQTILAAVKAFDPDLLVVDKLPLGFQNELQPTLEYMRDRAGRCILGPGRRDRSPTHWGRKGSPLRPAARADRDLGRGSQTLARGATRAASGEAGARDGGRTLTMPWRGRSGNRCQWQRPLPGS